MFGCLRWDWISISLLSWCSTWEVGDHQPICQHTFSHNTLQIPILSLNNIVQAPGLSEAGTWREPWGPQCTCSSSLEQDTRSQTSPFLVAAYITNCHKHSFSHLHKKYDIVKRHWFSIFINVNLPNVKVSKGPSIGWGALGIVGPIRVCLVVWK